MSTEKGFQTTEAVRNRLQAALDGASEETIRLILEIGGESERTSLDIPRRALEPLTRLLELMEQGADVEICAREQELTTGKAADLLNVSRPHLVELLESGEIPFHKVGSHRRVRTSDLLDYKRQRKQQSRKRLEELAREDEKLGIDY